MNLDFIDDSIIIKDKILTTLDQFVIDFTTLLNKENIKYVLISGYVSILFGRNRSSEDIDIFVEKLPYKTFTQLWKKIYRTYECIITSNVDDAYHTYLTNDTAIRFSKKNNFIPNIEFKFPKREIDEWTLQHRKKVIVNSHELYISPLELHISYKLFMGSEKDIEDAKFIYSLFKNNLDETLFFDFNRKFKTQELFNRYIK